MTNAVIAATGLYTPPHSLSNAELVETFNAYVERFNAANAAAIEAGDLYVLPNFTDEGSQAVARAIALGRATAVNPYAPGLGALVEGLSADTPPWR